MNREYCPEGTWKARRKIICLRFLRAFQVPSGQYSRLDPGCVA